MNGKIILLVEDNPDAITLTLHAFKKGEIENEIVIARDGAEVLDFLSATGIYAGRDPNYVPGVVLLDLRLPKVDGFEVLKKIRSAERTKYLPVVIFTASKETGDISECYRRGANSYIFKPVDYMEYIEVVKRVTKYWLSLNVPPPRKMG